MAKETAHVQGFKFGQSPQFRGYGASEGVGAKLQCHQVCQRAKGRRECAAKLVVLRITVCTVGVRQWCCKETRPPHARTRM